MTIENLLKKRNMTKYRLAVDAGIPHATLNDMQWQDKAGKMLC